MSEEPVGGSQEAEPGPGQLTPTVRGANCPIVGIGASAGGIDALGRLFPQVDPNTDLAFIVVMHLDPEHKSMLPAILARSTSLPVTQIRNETKVEPRHIYVIPPNSSLSIRDGRLLLAPLNPPRGSRNVIDEFFTLLARDQGENAACVVLSGTGSDGTVGLRAIKENGGLTLAQSEAEYDGMMRNAVATGLVDFILRAEEIPAKLGDYFGRIDDGRRQPGAGSDPSNYLAPITALLRTQTGHDFTNYRGRTIARRIQRRMHVLQIDQVSDFLERLRKDSREVNLLFHDLLIGVTNFFRDPDAFAALESKAIPHLFEGKGPEDVIRVWVPGCATGEEAYSIAILLREHAPKSERAPKLQVFASDIDEHALDVARIGRYPATISKDVPTHRLERYFLREDGTYRIASDLREICLFSSHNLLRDAPFSKLDLISCRNLLIYLNGQLQDRVIPLFHYSLNRNGYLFLGLSENVTRHSRLFFTVDNTYRIFSSRGVVERSIPQFPLTAPGPGRRGPSARAANVREPSLQAFAERELIDRFAPAYAVVNADGDLLQSSGRTGKYLELPAGAPNTNLLNMARPGLRLELRAALQRAVASGRPVLRPKVMIGTDGGQQEIDLCVQPLSFGGPTEALYMVVFQDLGAILPLAESKATPAAQEETDGSKVRQLEAELRVSKERLQTITEELESSNEELKSGNEELQSMNEELQSTNEELETSKEELQSINEELQTVNAELNARVTELSRANNDMANLLESTQIATVFLDRTLVVKGFTPAAKDVFRLVESDTGRPITHVRARFECDTFQEDAERVLRTLATIERRVDSNENDTRYIMRILPYRTTENVISGVVITFTDITRISAAEERIEQLTHDLRTRIDELETILELIPVGVMISADGADREVLINTYGAQLLGAEPRRQGLTPVPMPFRLFEDGQELTREQHPLERARAGETVSSWQGRLSPDGGDRAHVMISATPLFDRDRKVRGAVAAIVDITRHKEAEEQQQFLLIELQHRVKNILATISSLATRMSRSRSADEFKSGLLSRLEAMSRTHDLLAGGSWSGTSLKSLIEMALEPYATASDKANISLGGPEAMMTSNASTTLGVIFHELATNAAKYGALSAPGGDVDISWEQLPGGTADQGIIQLTWLERGGPPIDSTVELAGFGVSLISRSVEHELLGKVALELTPDGLRCTITFPVTDNVEVASSRAA
jgi:two-component system, chemotaxis family, CheB/CheR fusion protein